MGYEHIVAARNHLAMVQRHLEAAGEQPVQHFAFGGMSMPSLAGAAGYLAGGPAGAAGLYSAAGGKLPSIGDIGDKLGAANPMKKTVSHFNAEAPTNTFQSQAPVNGFQAQAPNINQTDFGSAITSQMGQTPGIPGTGGADEASLARALGERSQATYGQQQGLIGQLQQESGGQGPGASLAQNMLNQATQNNIKQGAGMIASARGINPALAAKMGAEQAGNMNQQAAAQGANLGFQQQLAARQQLGGMLGNQQALDTGTGAGLLTAGRGQDINQGLGLGQLGESRLNTLLGAQQGQNALTQQGSLAAQGINAQTAAQNANLGMQSQGLNAQAAAQNANLNLGAQQINAGTANQNAETQGKIVGGALNGMGSAGAAAAMPAAAVAASHGGRISGHANASGDSPSNDTVPAMLSPGEIVVPRSAADNPEAAKRFIDALMGGKKSPGVKGYGGVLNAKRELAELKGRMKALEQHLGNSA